MRQGSSPRVWGQDALGCLVKQRSRIIPTRVGTSGDNTSLCNLTKDHPHACGDKHFQANVSKVKPGSSPRVWGQAYTECRSGHTKRIIPTRVGTRVYHTLPYNYAWDHPHACGDKDNCPASNRFELGSSPRVWGQEANFPDMYDEHRIIPTRVGTRYPYIVKKSSYWDHPHACGDKFCFVSSTSGL